MRYRLRSLLILLAILPPLLALGYWAWPPKPEAVPELQPIGVYLRPPLFPPTPEEQAAINAWIAKQP